MKTTLIQTFIDLQIIQESGFYHVETNSPVHLSENLIGKGNRLLIHPNNEITLANFSNNQITHICDVNKKDVSNLDYSI